jgi:uncharacterized integral membrane protein
MKKLKLIGALTAVLLSVIMILQNTQQVQTKFLFVTITMPNAVLLGISLLIGIAVGILVSLTLSGKRKTRK